MFRMTFKQEKSKLVSIDLQLPYGYAADKLGRLLILRADDVSEEAAMELFSD